MVCESAWAGHAADEEEDVVEFVGGYVWMEWVSVIDHMVIG